MIRQTILLTLATVPIVLPFVEAVSQPLRLTVRQEDSQVEFLITRWGVFKEEGRFKDFEGTILFDASNPSTTSVDVTIRAASIDSRNEGRDRALRSKEFFYVDQYPTLTFKSVRAWALDQSTIKVEGDITIRGVTKRIAIPVKRVGFRDDHDVFHFVRSDGQVKTVVKNLAACRRSFLFTTDIHAIMGLWTDRSGSVYAAVMSDGAVKKVDPNGRVQIVARAFVGWAPTGGLATTDGTLWILESGATSARVHRIDKDGKSTVY